MADATITINADAAQAEATLEELRALSAELFTGIGLDAKKSAAAQEALAQAWKQQKVSLLDANNAAAALRPQVEGLSNAASKSAFNIKDLSKSLLGFASASSVIQANLSDLEAEFKPLIEDMKQYVIQTTGGSDASRLFAAQIESFLRPTTIAKNLIEQFVILWNQFRLATGQATEESIKQEAEQARINSQLDKYQKSLAESTQALGDRSVVLSRVIEQQMQEGEVTKTVRDDLKKLLDEYDKAGTEAPANVQALADKLGILSSAQERATEAADKHTGKIKEEKVAVEQSDGAFSALTEKLKGFTDGKRQQADATREATKALEEETRALEAQAKAAQDASGKAQQNLADAQKREKELRDKPVLSVDEAEELQKIQSNLNDLDAEAATTAEDAAQATFEYGEAQGELADSTADAADAIGDQGKKADYAAGVMSELDAATKAYEASIQAAGDSTASTNEIVETIGENGERKFTNLTEAAGEFGDVVVQAGEDGQQVMTNLGRATEQVAGALPDAASGLYDVAGALNEIDRAQGKGEDEKGLAKVGADAEKLAKEYLPEILRLVKEIGEEASKVTLGGGGGGGL